MLGVALLLAVSMVSIADGKAAPQNSLQHNQIRTQTDPSSGGSGGTHTPVSSGGCVTKWGWDGKQWVKRDLYVASTGKYIPGKYCTAFNPITLKAVAKPITPNQDYSAHELEARWFMYERNAQSRQRRIV